ncbi:MAG: hypothetical protein AVDCRST_MAG93-7342, partial [uncultured Chloroflexia bacterium]
GSRGCRTCHRVRLPPSVAALDIRGPNTDGDVWLFVDTPHRHHGFNLGRL